MNLLKSIFIMSYMMLVLMGLTAYAGYHLSAGGFQLAWLGVLLTTLPPLLFLMSLVLFKHTPRTSNRLPLILFLVVDGVIASLATADSAVPVAAALTGLVGFLLYNFWYSTLDRAPSATLAVGQPLPDFDLQDQEGNTVHAQSFLGQKNLWLFYRGNWCPLCMAQIKEIAAQYRELAERGVHILLVSPQPADHTRDLAQQFDVPFQFLVDGGNQAARQLGIAAPHGTPMGMQMLGYDSETVLPTVVIADETGQILFVDETDNYRVRPEPATFLRALESQGAIE